MTKLTDEKLADRFKEKAREIMDNARFKTSQLDWKLEQVATALREESERARGLVDALDTEEYEGEVYANDSQGGEYNRGASAVLKAVIAINKKALSEYERGLK